MRRDDAMGIVAELAASLSTVPSAADRPPTTGCRAGSSSGWRPGRRLEPVRGVLVFRAARVTWRQRMMVATLARPGLNAGFRAAGHLQRVDGLHTPPVPEVVGPRWTRSVTGLDVVQHWVERLDPDDLTVVDGIPCTGLARTVVDVCGLGDHELAVRAVDDFDRRRHSLNWLRLTAERLHRPGQRGTGVVLRLLDERQRGGRVPDSWFERLVERCVAIPGLPPWRRQHVLSDGAQFVGRLDLACPALMLGVEAHSRHFHFGRAAEAFDQHRDNRASAAGWHIVYVGWYDTEDPATVAATIARIAEHRAAMLGVSLPWAA